MRPDKRGTYKIRLAASERRPGRAGGSQAHSAVDQVSVQAAPAVGPMGVPIQTLADGGGIQIGGQTYTTSANWVQVLTLDRATLEVNENVGFDVDEAFNLGLFLAGEAQLNPNQMVILSGGGRSFYENGGVVNGFDQQNSDALTEAYAMLGGDNDPDGPMFATGWTLADGDWSLIGQFDLAPATATQNHSMVTGGDGQKGSLTGYLQQDQFKNYAFVSTDNVSVDTSAPGAPANTNVIQVGDARYQSLPIGPGAGGFQLLVLDSQLGLVANQTVATNDDSGAPIDDGVSGLAELLHAQESDPGDPVQNLVILQSIGRPGGADGYWLADQDATTNDATSWGSSLAGAVGRLGGPAAHDQIAQMIAPQMEQPTPQAQGGYTLIASTELSDPYDDAYSLNQALSQVPAARVVGSIARNHDSQWVMQSPSSVSGFDTGTLAQLAYQAPTPFPLSTGPYLTASRWIANQLGFLAPDVRTAYYENAGGKWGSDLYRQLNGLAYESGNGFTRAQYTALRTQLLREFTLVDEVWGMIGDWQKSFGDSSFTDYVDLQTIGGNVVKDIQAEQNILQSTGSVDPLAVIGSSLWIAQGISSIAGQEEVAVGLGVAAASIDLMDSVASQGADGGLSIAPIEAEAQDLGVQLAVRYDQLSGSFGRLGNLFVGDWGKLQQAARNSNGIWESNTDVTGAIKTTMTRATQATFYTSLLPLAYGQYVLQSQPSDINPVPWQDPWNYRCESSDGPNTFTNPFTPTQQNQASWVVGALRFGDVGNGAIGTFRQVRLLSTQIDWQDDANGPIEHEPQVLPPDVSNTLFQPLSTDTGLGLDQVRFFGNPAFTRWSIFCNND